MSKFVFNAILSLMMASDPSPLHHEYNRALMRWADEEARRRGFDGWIDAYNKLPSTMPSRVD